jgi:hypothetical protein
MNLTKIIAGISKVAKSKEGKVAIAVASVVLPAVAPKAVAKGARIVRKVKAAKRLAE